MIAIGVLISHHIRQRTCFVIKEAQSLVTLRSTILKLTYCNQTATRVCLLLLSKQEYFLITASHLIACSVPRHRSTLIVKAIL